MKSYACLLQKQVTMEQSLQLQKVSTLCLLFQNSTQCTETAITTREVIYTCNYTNFYFSHIYIQPVNNTIAMTENVQQEQTDEPIALFLQFLLKCKIANFSLHLIVRF